jgi:hypothetical protein
MANNYTMSPWVIDTESDFGIGPYSNEHPLFVERFEWVGYGAEGDACIVKDWRNLNVVEMRGEADRTPQEVWVPPGTYYYGLHATQLGGGKLLIYIA